METDVNFVFIRTTTSVNMINRSNENPVTYNFRIIVVTL